MKTRFFLVDDHDMVREGLTKLLTREAGLELAGEAGSSVDALRGMREVPTDIALVDITLQGANGLELVKCLQSELPGLPVLVVSMHDERVYATRAIRAGARGYCSKNAPVGELVQAIRTVLSGRIYVSAEVATLMLEHAHQGGSGSPLDELTDRELEVFERIGEGLGTREIADKLHLSVKTIESYRANIKKKLQIRSAPELVRRAVLFVELPA